MRKVEDLLDEGIGEFPKDVRDALAWFGDLLAEERQRRHLAECLTRLRRHVSVLFFQGLKFLIMGQPKYMPYRKLRQFRGTRRHNHFVIKNLRR